MGNEVELKLQVPPAMLRALRGAPWLHKMAAAPAHKEKLVSVYFDTGKRALREEGLSLRVRRVGDRHVQTVKCGGEINRKEWEDNIKSAAPDRDAARETGLKPFTGKKQWRRIRPLFETDVTRVILPVRAGDSDIEVALDQGKVKAGRRSQPIHEVELELKKGRVADLERLARRIAHTGKASLGVRSKGERGHALADGKTDDHASAASIALADGMTAAEGFRIIAFSCLHHLGANRAAVLAGDPEGIHQMRVGTRRLRAALSLFKPLVTGPRLEKVKADLKWLSGELGPARDFDVFVRKTVQPGLKNPSKGLHSLEADLKKRRAAGFARARRMVRGERYRRILLDIGLWITGGDWAVGDSQIRKDLRQRPLKDMARDILRARTAKVARKLRKLEKLDARKRHKLRIAVKKLRYADGFFESLFPRHKRFAHRLADLQGALGRLNDIRVHGQFARKQIGRKRQLPRGAFALGVLTGEERAAAKNCMAAAARAGKRFRSLPACW